MSAKWGIFGRSFNDIGNAISGKISDINKNFQATDDLITSIKNSGDSIWKRLYPSKEEIQSQMIDVDSLIPEINSSNVVDITEKIKGMSSEVSSGKTTWQELFDILPDGEKHFAQLGQQMEGQIITTEGVAKANRQARSSALAHNESLKQQTLGAKAASVAMNLLSTAANMLVMYAISKLITAWDDYKEKLHEVANENAEQAEKSAEYVENLLDLQNQLKEGTKNSDELTKAFKEQLRAMDYTEDKIDDLIVKYGGLSGAISETTRKALENAKTDAYTDLASASKALEIDSLGGLTTDILITDFGTGIDELDKQINEILSEVATKTAEQGQAWITKDGSAEGLYAYYNALQKVSRLIQETASETNNQDLLNLGNVFDTTTYGEITEAIDKLKESAGLYGDAISRLHNADAQLELSNYLKTNNINSKEAFDSYVDGIKNNTTYSEVYKQVLLEVANDAFPQFSAAAKDVSDTLSDSPDKITVLSFSDLFNADSIDEIKQKLLDLATSGELSEETITSTEEYKALLDQTAMSAQEFVDAIEDFNIDNINNNLSKYESTLQKIHNGQTLQAEEISELIVENEDLADAVLVVGDAYSLEESALENIINKYIETSNVAISHQIEQTKDTIQSIKDRLEYYGLEIEVMQHIANIAKEYGYNSASSFATGKYGYEILSYLPDIINMADEFDVANEKLQELIQKAKESYSNKDKYNKEDVDYKDLLDKETTLLEKQLEASVITFEDYVYKRKAIINEYYDDALITAEEYYSALEDIYNHQISLYDRVVSAVTNRIDVKISELEGDKQDIENIYNSRISKIQEEIESLEKANEARKAQIELEELQYKREQARNNRNQKLYTGSKGVIYTADVEAVRDAENDLADKEFELNISRLESQIESLEKELDNATESVDNQIEKLENYAESWRNVADEYENSQDAMIAANILGQNWEKDILNQREATLDVFRDKYVSAYKEMENATLRLAQVQANNANVGNSVGNGEENTKKWHFKGKEYDSQQEAVQARQEFINNAIGNALKAGMPLGESSVMGAKLTKQYPVEYYHSGLDIGYVGDNKTALSKNKRLEILQLAGKGELLKSNEELDVLQKEELVLTKGQQINIADTLLQRAFVPNINLPDYSHLNNIISRNDLQPTIVNIGDIRMEGVQNVTDFAKELQKHLPSISVQFRNKH